MTSSYVRAVQTAKLIQEITNVPIIESDLLIEQKMPSEFLGRPVDEPTILVTHAKMRKHFYEADWHYSDEENFADLLSRAKLALDFISSQGKEEIVAVTHGYFLTVLVYLMIFGDSNSAELFRYFREHTVNSNTGLTVCEYKNGVWKLLTWNDIAHLGE